MMPKYVPSFVGYQVLIVDDVAASRTLLRALLTPTDAHIDVAEDGLTAIEKLKKQPFHLVLMDIQMPRLDGLSAVRRIRSDPSIIQPMGIIALTANASPGARSQYLRYGFNDYLSKPFLVDEMYHIVQKIFAQNAGLNGKIPQPSLDTVHHI